MNRKTGKTNLGAKVMPCEVRIVIGNKTHSVDGQLIPPVGTRIGVHKYLGIGGDDHEVEVTRHEWEFMPSHDGNGGDANPVFHVTIQTRPVK